MENVDEYQDVSAVQQPPVEVEVTDNKGHNKETNEEETKKNPVKRSSKRLQTKTQLKEASNRPFLVFHFNKILLTGL